MRITPEDLVNWRRSEQAKARNPKRFRPCGTTGRYLPPHLHTRCPHGCEPRSWRPACRVCGTPTVPLHDHEEAA